MNPDLDLPTDSWVVNPLESGKRLDAILASHYPDLHSRTYFVGLIETGFVTVDGQQVKKRTLLQTGQQVDITFILRPELSFTPEKMDFKILYEDPYFLAINKPAGLVVHPAPGHWSGTFVHGLLYHCQNLTLSKENIRPGIVHRLDKETTGVLLAAKQANAHQKLVEAFASREVKKRYLAICIGNPGSGTLTTQMNRDPTCRVRMAVVPEGGRTAITHYHTLMTQQELSLVQIELFTGRTHQARVHMQHLQAPVLGDPIYGRTTLNTRYGVTRQMLHAHELQLPHPTTGETLHLVAPPPADMLLLLEKYFPGYAASIRTLA